MALGRGAGLPHGGTDIAARAMEMPLVLSNTASAPSPARDFPAQRGHCRVFWALLRFVRQLLGFPPAEFAAF